MHPAAVNKESDLLAVGTRKGYGTHKASESISGFFREFRDETRQEIAERRPPPPAGQELDEAVAPAADAPEAAAPASAAPAEVAPQ